MARRTMRSPRRIDFSHPALRKLSFDESPPAKDSISWRLWLKSRGLAQKALSTEYIQGIANGDLDPNNYGGYSIQDVSYCYRAQDDYAHLVKRAGKASFPELAAFAKARGDSYAKYTQELLKQWHIADPRAVRPSPAAQAYIDFEHRVATTFEPIYGIIAMIPCDQLWPWLATELKTDDRPGNLYSFWIQDNGDWKGAYRLDNFVDAWFARYPKIYKADLALYVFRSCMTCEVNFFRSGCGQRLLPMPKAPN